MTANDAVVSMMADTASTRQVARAIALRERVRESRQRAILDHWIALAQDRPVTRRDLSPEMFGRALQYVNLIEVMGDEYRHVIEGREVIRRFGRSEPEPFGKLYEASYLGRLRAFYATVQMTCAPNLRAFAARSMMGEEMAFTQLVLPATDADGHVSHLAVVFGFPNPIARIPTAPLTMHSAWRRLGRGTERETIPGDRLWR